MKRLFTIITAVLLTATIWAQSPQKMSYQAVIRNASGVLVQSSNVGMRITILQGSISGTVVYTEIQTPTTNANGLISIEIGGGAGFDAINWTSGPYFIKTETDPAGGTNYTIIGTSQLLSVPYALYAKTAETATETDPVFNVHAASAITAGQITDWNTAYGWGNHALAGYVPDIRTLTINGTDLDLSSNRTWNVGTVTSVGLSLPGIFSVSGSPVTANGTLSVSLSSQSANLLFASPNGSLGTPAFRALVAADIPDLDWNKITTGKPTTLNGYGISDAAGINLSNTFNVGPQILLAGSAGNKGLIVRGSSAQTANLQEWQASDGTVLTSITKNGDLDLGSKLIRYAAPFVLNYCASFSNLYQQISGSGTVTLYDSGIQLITGSIANSVVDCMSHNWISCLSKLNTPGTCLSVKILWPSSHLIDANTVSWVLAGGQSSIPSNFGRGWGFKTVGSQLYGVVYSNSEVESTLSLETISYGTQRCLFALVRSSSSIEFFVNGISKGVLSGVTLPSGANTFYRIRLTNGSSTSNNSIIVWEFSITEQQ